MKDKLYFFLLFIVLSNCLNYAQSKGFGLGIVLGTSTGLSAKYWLSETNSYDFGLSHSLINKSRIDIWGNFLFHISEIFKEQKNISLYYGPGVKIKFSQKVDSFIGFRSVIGLVLIPKNSKVDIFFEVAPIVYLLPATEFSIDGGIGVRFFFN